MSCDRGAFMQKITFNIDRFDGKKRWQQQYKFEYKPNTLLACLNMIKETQDDSLCFNQACGHCICGSCAVQVNGSAFLACETQLDELISTYNSHVFHVSPLQNFPVVRDLVVSFDEKSEKMKKVFPWMCEKNKRSQEHEHRQTAAERECFAAATDCILCGICASECRELFYDNNSFLDPFMLNRAYRFARDSRDECEHVRISACLDNNLWKCIHCKQCSSKCPKNIDIAQEVSYLRRKALAYGEFDCAGARHANAFFDDLLETGRLNEEALALKTEGLAATLFRRTPFALRMMKAGKINPLQVFDKQPIKDIEQVQHLYYYAQKRREQLKQQLAGQKQQAAGQYHCQAGQTKKEREHETQPQQTAQNVQLGHGEEQPVQLHQEGRG